MSADAEEVFRQSLGTLRPGSPLANVPKPPMTTKAEAPKPPTAPPATEPKLAPVSVAKVEPANAPLRPPRVRKPKKPAKVEPDEEIKRTRTGTLKQPYEREDGVKTIKFTCTLPIGVVVSERQFSGGLLPPWDRNEWLEYVIVTAMKNHEKNGTPYPGEDFWKRKGRKL